MTTLPNRPTGIAPPSDGAPKSPHTSVFPLPSPLALFMCLENRRPDHRAVSFLQRILAGRIGCAQVGVNARSDLLRRAGADSMIDSALPTAGAHNTIARFAGEHRHQ